MTIPCPPRCDRGWVCISSVIFRGPSALRSQSARSRRRVRNSVLPSNLFRLSSSLMVRNNPPYHCIIVDDDEIDRLTALSYTSRYPFLVIDSVYPSTEEALAGIMNRSPDVLLLDIDLPGLDGIGFRRLVMDVPVCIFITAYSEHAVKGYEVAAFDFIEKPLTGDRFTLTMKRLEDYMDVRQKASLFELSLGDTIVYIKDGSSQIRLKVHEILFLEAMKYYTRIVTVNKKFFVNCNLGALLKEKAF